MVFYVSIIIAALVAYTLQGWLSHQSQYLGGNWTVYLWICGLLPLWPIVTRFSQNIVFDALVFDITLLVGFQAGMIAGGATANFSVINYVGIVLTCLGLTLLKV